MSTKSLYIDESCHLEHDGFPVMCIGYTKINAEDYGNLKEGIKSIKLKHNAPTEIKWNKLSKMKTTMDKIIKASEGKTVDFDEGEAVEFIVKKSYLSMTDPCHCGSGKQVINCCIPRENFIKISQKNKGK